MSEEKFYGLKKQILSEIKKANTVIIHRHEKPDPDALGAQGGLAELIRQSFPEVEVFTAGEDNRTLEFLTTMDPPAVSDYEDALIIIVDTANTPRIDGKDALAHGNKTIKIDHHPDEDRYGDIQWVDPSASSTSEMIADFAKTFPEDFLLNNEAARLLYGGIVGDTNRFLYKSTTAKTMYLAGYLMEKDFSSTDLNNKMDEIDHHVSKLIGYVFEHLQVSENGVGSIVLTKEILERFSVSDEDTHKVVPLPGNIVGVLSWGVFVEQDDGTFRCRLRSKGPVINGIAKEHDGGGHPLASGANAADEAEIQVILEKFDEVTKNYRKN